MKFILFGSIFCLLFSANILAEIGCMDTSYHAGQLDDPKLYYVVTGADGGPCSCPCSKYCAQYRCSSLARGKCPVCGHYRIPRSYVIVRKTKQEQESQTKTNSLRFKLPVMHKRAKTHIARVP